MEINISVENSYKGCLDTRWLEKIAGLILVAQGVKDNAELSLSIVGQEWIHRLNLSYRGENEATDVLSFTLLPEPSGGDQPAFVTAPDGIQHLGEVVISYPQAVIQAEERQHSVRREVAILLIHGVLHLLGYDHEKPGEKRQMGAREKEILGQIEEALK